ncbi:MAG: hypothetical protein V1862_08280, partial [Methanobacteriota archaeon]
HSYSLISTYISHHFSTFTPFPETERSALPTETTWLISRNLSTFSTSLQLIVPISPGPSTAIRSNTEIPG